MGKAVAMAGVIILALHASFFAVAVAADYTPSFVGQKYFKDYTKELKAPSCRVEDASESIEKTQLTLLFAECHHRHELLLSKVSAHGAENSIVHQLTVRELKKGEAFHNNGPYCYFGQDKGKRIPFVGIFKGWNKNKPMTKKSGVLLEGWMVNSISEKIEPLSAEKLDKVSCLDESGGED
jgi:hypothetical protein